MNKLLIIDDQIGILQMLKRRLAKFNYEVYIVSNHEDAMQTLETKEIDLVLLDYMMPHITGFDLFMLFRDKYDIPVIMMTAHSSIHLAIEFMKKGGIDFIEKPLDIDVLNMRINRAIVQAQAFKKECLAKEKAQLALMLANKELTNKTSILKQKNEELDTFATAISHDLRTPARNIHSFIGLLKRKLDIDNQDKDVQEFFHFIEQGSIKMNMMVSKLLEMAKMGELNKKKQLIDTNEMVIRIMNTICTSYPDYQTKFSIKPLPIIIGDPILIEQVFYNLIENAVKYSHLKPQPFVEISAIREDNSIVFAIKDNGIGFDMMYAERLFDIFVRLETENKFEGTGIGLANVKKIIKHHNGDVWVQSKKDVETIFYFSIPC